MIYINTTIQMALNYSEGLDYAFGIIVAIFFYLTRLKRKIFYGIIEIVIGLYLMSFSFQSKGDFNSKDFSNIDFNTDHLTVALTAYLSAIFVMIRGLDNIHSEWKNRDRIR